MPISVIGNRPARDGGYSLVEALATLAIVALVASAIVPIAPGSGQTTRELAEGLAARATLASEESIARNRPVALMLTSEGYGFARLDEKGWTRIEAPSPLAFRAWPEGLDYRVKAAAIDASQRESARLVRFDALGGATPACVVLSDASERWSVEIDGQARAHVSREK